jgi:endonuclease/exonuclease/phosphatase family metal-dependent hydrolase
MWYATLLNAGVLLLCYLAPYVPPTASWPLAFLGLTYPALVLLNLSCLAYWAFFRRKRMLVPLFALLLGWNHLNAFVQWHPGHRMHQALDPAVKVMSYNVRLFDLYDWGHNTFGRNEIFDLLVVEDADILCLQEFFHADDKAYFPTRDTLMANFRWTRIHDAYVQHARKSMHFGIATLSTYPIVDKGLVPFPAEHNNVCTWTDIATPLDTLRVYNAHLASVRFGLEDYAFLEGVGLSTPPGTLSIGSRRITHRLRSAFHRRTEQTRRVVAHMRTSPHPVIYCGDMNDTPMGYCYAQLTREAGLVDAFMSSGNGFGQTYVGVLPGLRIDHVLHDKQLRSWGFRTLPDELSDHHPLVCWVGKANP